MFLPKSVPQNTCVKIKKQNVELMGNMIDRWVETPLCSDWLDVGGPSLEKLTWSLWSLSFSPKWNFNNKIHCFKDISIHCARVSFPPGVMNRFLVRCRLLKRAVQRTTAKQTCRTWPLSTRYHGTSLIKYHSLRSWFTRNHKIIGLLLFSSRFQMQQGQWNWPKSRKRVRLPRTCSYVTTASSWTTEPTARSLFGKVRGLNKLNTTVSASLLEGITHAVSCCYRKITNGRVV